MIEDIPVLSIALIVAVAILLVVAFSVGKADGYKHGQIDAINGSIHWQLEKQADGSMQWNECDGVCKR